MSVRPLYHCYNILCEKSLIYLTINYPHAATVENPRLLQRSQTIRVNPSNPPLVNYDLEGNLSEENTRMARRILFHNNSLR